MNSVPQLPRRIALNSQTSKLDLQELMRLLGESGGNSHATPSLNSSEITPYTDARTVYNPVLKSFYDGD